MHGMREIILIIVVLMNYANCQGSSDCGDTTCCDEAVTVAATSSCNTATTTIVVISTAIAVNCTTASAIISTDNASTSTNASASIVMSTTTNTTTNTGPALNQSSNGSVLVLSTTTINSIINATTQSSSSCVISSTTTTKNTTINTCTTLTQSSSVENTSINATTTISQSLSCCIISSTTAAKNTTINTCTSLNQSSCGSANSSSSSTGIVTLIVGFIAIILLVLGIVTMGIVFIFIRRMNIKNYAANKKIPPLSVTGLSVLNNDEPTDNPKNLELENRSTFNIANTSVSVESSGNPVFTESINTSALLSHDSKYDETPAPCNSVYTDPIPLVKGPPVVSIHNIKEIRELGNGLFGEVILAETVGLSDQYLGIGYGEDTTISKRVAVKLLKSSASAEVKNAFDKEIRFMSRLKDDNVIRLLGICTTGTPFIMMEYMESGDLNAYLQQKKFMTNPEKPPASNEITISTLVYMSYQIASGMNYLSSCKFVHRDLAARNILVGFDNTVKIADFGMSQNLYSAYYCQVDGRSVLPIRWIAYECFFGKFSVKTDVWAFGITLWEIFTLCRCLPYNDFTNQKMVEDALRGAKRKIPSQPESCPDDIYCIIKSCLQHDPPERADFKTLRDQLYKYYTNLH